MSERKIKLNDGDILRVFVGESEYVIDRMDDALIVGKDGPHHSSCNDDPVCMAVAPEWDEVIFIPSGKTLLQTHYPHIHSD